VVVHNDTPFDGYDVRAVLDFIDGKRTVTGAGSPRITPANTFSEDFLERGLGEERKAYYGSPTTLPTGSAARKDVPLVRGVVDYFPAALAEVARVSKAGNDKHNPGQDMHHARGKSTDHADCLLRHLVDRGKIDPETGQRHSAQVAWRALALLQQELEDDGEAPMPRGARLA